MTVAVEGDQEWGVALHRGVSRWISARPTSANESGRAFVYADIVAWFERLSFDVTRAGPEPGIIVAQRHGAVPFRIGVMGHYDVELAGDGWTRPPFEISRSRGRVFGRGVADNLGPLWLRLAALEAYAKPTPSLLFVLQGEEEIGSPTAHREFPRLSLPKVDLWLEETGYFELDGAQRILARHLDSVTEPLAAAVERTATEHGRDVRRHDRYLNKAFGTERCPFQTHLLGTAPYLAIGPNDPASAIHGPDESLPQQHLGLSVRQFHALLGAAVDVA